MGLKTGVIGAAGFAGAELVRILVSHPKFELSVITSSSDEGLSIASLYPSLQGFTDAVLVSHESPELFECEVIFMATPHTVAMNMVPQFLERGITVIDLSADYRLKNKEVYEAWYGVPHTSAHLLQQAHFGLPEIKQDEILAAQQEYKSGKAVLVSCAGCYPTATSLALYPVADHIQGLVIADAISGVSGAGRAAGARTHFCHANENFEAYSVGSHRHTPEIEQILSIEGRLVFTPHLAPASRGLLSTVTCVLAGESGLCEAASPKGKMTHNGVHSYSVEEIHALYKDCYQAQPFVEVLPLGVMPQTSSVVGTNKAHIGIAQSTSTQALIAVCAIDNLVKGAAGQAVQCANIVCGFDQTLGLSTVGMPA